LERLSSPNFKDRKEVEIYFKKLFVDFQNAWMSQDLSLVSDCFEEELLQKYQLIINKQIEKGRYNYIGNIELEHVKFFAFKKNALHDVVSFKVYYDGYLKDSIVKHGYEPKDKETISYFEDIFYIRIVNQRFVVYNVDNYASIFNIFKK